VFSDEKQCGIYNVANPTLILLFKARSCH